MDKPVQVADEVLDIERQPILEPPAPGEEEAHQQEGGLERRVSLTDVDPGDSRKWEVGICKPLVLEGGDVTIFVLAAS